MYLFSRAIGRYRRFAGSLLACHRATGTL